MRYPLAILFIAALACFPLSEQLKTSFVHTDQMPERDVFVAIVSGHGSIIDNTYQTAGKQSPEWPDGLKIYEGKSTHALALQLAQRLDDLDIDYTIVNPEPWDISLHERVRRCNALYLKDRRTVCVFLHHNAQPVHNQPSIVHTDSMPAVSMPAASCYADYTDPYGLSGYTSSHTGGAIGNEIFTSIGQTKSDCLAHDIAQALQTRIPDMPLRFDISDGDLDKEANFYVLRNTYAPAVLIEFGFMTTWTDCQKIVDPEYRIQLILSIIDGLNLYAPAINNKQSAINNKK